jgi:hypothetical protein
MTGKSKIQLDLGFGQPEWFLSAKAQDDWQVKKSKIQLDLDFGQPQWFLSAKAQDDWQVKNPT